jgi:hypothetical protein
MRYIPKAFTGFSFASFSFFKDIGNGIRKSFEIFNVGALAVKAV